MHVEGKQSTRNELKKEAKIKVNPTRVSGQRLVDGSKQKKKIPVESPTTISLGVLSSKARGMKQKKPKLQLDAKNND